MNSKPTLTPSGTLAGLPPNHEQRGISARAPAEPKVAWWPSLMSSLLPILVGGATQSLTGRSRCLLSALAAARKWPMLVMHEPMHAASSRPCRLRGFEQGLYGHVLTVEAVQQGDQ